jgi:hypothetical protein
MKTIIGSMLSIIGTIMAWVCGLGFTISVVLWVLSVLGLPLVVGAGMFIFKFAGGWLIGVILALLGVTMVTTA